MKTITPSQITFSFGRKELFEKICNISALNAKYVSEEVNIDSLVISSDEKYFFDTNIESIVASLANYFIRIITDRDKTYAISDTEIAISFNAHSIEDGRLTQVEVDILHSLVEEYIITEMLRLWYHSVAPHELLATKYNGESAKIDRRLRIVLFQFYKPAVNGSIIDCIKVRGIDDDDIIHINNRSDFVLVWKSKDFAALPNKFSISFYTNGETLYEVSYPDATEHPKVLPITDANGRMVAAHIIFDLSNGSNYFQDGRLRYTMVADIPNPMFEYGIQTIESSEVLPIEIWGGPSDQVAKVEASFIPPYAKLVLADLTPEEIAILQGPANSAATNAYDAANAANSAAQYANAMGQFAYAQGNVASNAAIQANSAASDARGAIKEIEKTNTNIKEADERREKAEENRKTNEQNRIDSWDSLSKTVNNAISSAYQNSAAARTAAEKAEKAYDDVTALANNVVENEKVRIEKEHLRQTNEEGRIATENDRVLAENSRKTNELSREAKEIKRNDAEILRDSAEQKRTTAETERSRKEGLREDAEILREQREVKRQEDTASAIASANTAAQNANEAREGIQDDLAKKADIDKSYPKMTAGFAQDIVGDGSATPEEFSFRPTAGEDRNVANTTYYDGERNGVARIEKIKGNSVVANNCIGNIIGQKGYFVTQYEDGSFLVKRNPEITSGVYFSDFFAYDTKIINHKYAIIIHYVAYNIVEGGYIDIKFYNLTSGQYGPYIIQNGEGITTTIVTCANTTTTRPTISYIPDGEEEILIKSRYAIDLTKMFGAGNEPTTVEEFYQRLPVGIDISEYNEGEIIDGNYGAIKTVGFNAFNGTYAKVCAGCPYYLGGSYTSLGFSAEEGGTLEVITIPTSAESVGTTPSDRLYTPSQNGYIYADGENININISWGTEYGYLNGTYQPYKPFERDLSWIKTIKDSTGNAIFPNGMRSAGSVRDEIRFNSTTQKWEAVQNVGVVDLGTVSWNLNGGTFLTSSLDGKAKGATQYNVVSNILTAKYEASTWNDVFNLRKLYDIGMTPTGIIRIYDTRYSTAQEFKSAMQGVVLNYELATPIVTEIEEMSSMDFDVSDYGTEELIVAEGAQSAPLVADITYAPNALNTLKQVPDILKRLKALESVVASATATTNEDIVE